MVRVPRGMPTRRAVLILFAASALVGLPARAQDNEVEEILARHLDAVGGREALKSLQTLQISGRMTLGPDVESPFTRYAKRPNLLRFEMEVAGSTNVQAFDGSIAWSHMPMIGQTEPQLLPAEMAALVERDAEMDDPLVDYKERGLDVELRGAADVRGVQCYEVVLTLESGEVVHYFISSESFLVKKTAGTTSLQGVEIEYENFFGDYREVEGLMIPYTMEAIGMQGPGSHTTLTIDSVEINAELDDSLFRMPSRAPIPRTRTASKTW